MRERGFNRRRGTEREWREREESPERGEKRVRSDMDTDVESTQSRQKKGQMKSIFLSDSDEEAIVEFVKQHEEMYDKTNNSFKDKQQKENLACEDCEEVVRYSTYQICQAHSDEVRTSS